MATDTQLKALSEALSFDSPPFCSGTTSPSPEAFYLYYGGRDPKFINFASATPEELDQLSAACEPATFGNGKEDVYDETYRKAGKMDASNFIPHFDPVGAGLIRTIESQLVPTQGEKERSIKAEIYKLNVYGKDSFFKSHKDTPRGTDMLGSLVIVYPTPHKGGELVLRHKGREWTFDADSLTSSQPSPSVAYIAFYSDIEHEVLKVSSGCRVTITYNLYLAGPTLNKQVPSVVHNLRDISNLQSTLQNLLKSPEFLPDGGTLGFGLAHQYPVTFKTELKSMIEYLKGEDARVYRACTELQLKPSLRMVYDDDELDWNDVRVSTRPRGIMLRRIVEQPQYDHTDISYREYLIKKLGGVPINLDNSTVAKESEWVQGTSRSGVTKKYRQIIWVAPFKEGNRLKDVATAYGNQVATDFVYCSPCLIVPIDPASDRV